MKHILLSILLFNVCANAASNKSYIKFLNYHFDPVVQLPVSNNTPSLNAEEQGLHLVQFDDHIKQNWLDDLKSQGLTLIQYYPDNTYLVWGSTEHLRATENNSHVRWAGHFARDFRQSPNLKGRSGIISNVDVHFYNSGSPDSIVNKLKGIGAEVLHHYPAQPDKKMYDAIIRINANDITKIKDIAEVVWYGYIGAKPKSDDESSSQTIAGNIDATGQPLPMYENWLNTIGLDGTGVTWAITDTGVDYTHIDLNSRIVGGHNYPGCNETNPGDDPASGGHGTHVAGIIGGDATGVFADSDGYLYGLGVAPNYSIFAQNPICGTQASWPPAGGWQELSKQAVLGGAVGSNNSWTSGEGINHGYQSSERTIDFASRDGNFDTTDIAEEFMWVFSAGNSGPGANSLTAPKEAKNVIVTAGTQTWRVSDNVDAMYNSSSRGPSVDGRFVPTIAAPGERVGSTRNNDGGSCGTAITGTNNLYSFCTGTSMAAPHVSGALVLITDWWRDNNAGVNPSVAMGKALLINTAVDITDNASGPIPNFNEGWGRINLKNLFQPETPFELFDQQNVLNNSGEQWQTTVGIVDPSKPLKVTLVWSDAPGAVGANPALVNNLDLEVSSGSNDYLGNVFDNGTSVTGGSSDLLNNMENVFINNPGGSATITVKATSISGDGVFYSGDETDQDFALVCSNCALQPDFIMDIIPTELSVCSPNEASYGLFASSILSFEDPVTFSTTGLPTGAIEEFTGNPVIPGNKSSLNLLNMSSVALGSHQFDLNATSTTGTKTRTLTLNVFDENPSAVVLTSPNNDQVDVDVMNTFTWGLSAQGGEYILEIDDDPNFTSIDYSASTTDSEHTLTEALNTSTQYYWRIRVNNACGSNTSPVFNFSTEVAAGDCPIGVSQVDLTTYNFEAADLIYSSGFESSIAPPTGDNGMQGWTVEALQGTATWGLQSTIIGSGAQAFNSTDQDTTSDNVLTSPVISVPSGNGPYTLRFWNQQSLESRGAGGCWDGGLLEISQNGGPFEQVTNDKMINDPYDGALNAGPLNGSDAWCGDSQAGQINSVDIDDFAGSDIQVRFRIVTDGSVGRPEGWTIDDVRVTGCEVN